MNSIMRADNAGSFLSTFHRFFKRRKSVFFKQLAVLFWLALWQLIAMMVNMEILLVSPLSVIQTLSRMIVFASFWKTVWNSFFHIIIGFFLALLCGTLLAVLANKMRLFKEFLSPLISVLKAVPVVSFIILLLVTLQKTSSLSTIISFMMVLPIIYTNILTGLKNTDKPLLEMAKVFKLSAKKKFLFIYVSNVMPYFVSACSVALGLCWKAGVAAEVIGQLGGTIGGAMFDSKLWLFMSELFAWTVVIILISVVFEKLFLSMVKYFKRRIEE